MARSTQLTKIREILQYHESGLESANAIGRALKIDNEAVSRVIKIAKEQKLSYENVKEMDDNKLYLLFYPKNSNIKYTKPEVDVNKILDELRKNKTLTVKMLWEEYKAEHPDGLGYTQFCERIRNSINERKITMHIERIPGEKMYVDWAGDTLNIYNSITGEEIKVYLFVASIGVSSYTYVEGFLSTKQECYIQGNVNALKYFDALPKFIVPDNDKSAVTKACKYDPTINETFKDMANHYGITIFPTRIISPKDKGSVEKAVLDAAERNIINRFRNIKFFSIEELNDRIIEELNKFNQKPYQKEPNSNRYNKFLTIDKPAMKPILVDHYEYSIFKIAKVHIDSHIEVDYKCYSVPFKYIGKDVNVKIGTSKLSIYYENVQIAVHNILKSSEKRYQTKLEHLPERQQAFLRQTKKDFMNWAAKISPYALLLIDTIFNSSSTEEYAYRPCLGLKRLYKTYGPTRFIESCKKAAEDNIKTYKYVRSLLENNINNSTEEKETIINHTNLRGSKTYKKVGGLK